MAIIVLTGSEDLAAVITKVNEIIGVVNTLSTANTANTATLAAHSTKLTEIYAKFDFDSEEPAPESAPEIPTDEIEVTISAVARTFTFNVARFNYNKRIYKASDIIADLGSEDTDIATAAADVVKGLVALGSVIIDGEGEGILTETT